MTSSMFAFFFSSRRRHTRCSRDWSSDVCSSDLFNQFANFVPSQYDKSLPNPLNPDGTLNPASLTSFGGQSFFLNGIREAGVGGFPVGNVHNSYNTVEPRFGFAYSLTGDGKTALRGGVGLFFE